jgi:RNA polymerase sigma-70 factor (ECF subfamily)
MSDKLKERLLLFKIRTQKDKDAFGSLYDLYIERIYRFIYFKVNNKEEAEDLTSELFLKAWNYLLENQEKEIVSFSGLIYKMARNLIVDFYRRKAQQVIVNVEEVIETLPDDKKIMEQVEYSHDTEKLLAVIKKLKQEYQEVVMLKYVEELSISEIASILERSQVSVRVTLFRAMKKIKEMIEQ